MTKKVEIESCVSKPRNANDCWQPPEAGRETWSGLSLRAPSAITLRQFPLPSDTPISSHHLPLLRAFRDGSALSGELGHGRGTRIRRGIQRHGHLNHWVLAEILGWSQNLPQTWS